jgi:hypothetical protein
MYIAPLSFKQICEYIDEHHRHNKRPRGYKFGVGLFSDNGELIGVGACGRPVARMLNDGVTTEITRVCTVGARNANSMIYGALIRAAKALGYKRIVTYTLPDESGSSLRAVGFTEIGLTKAESWNRPSRARKHQSIYEAEKVRWIIAA